MNSVLWPHRALELLLIIAHRWCRTWYPGTCVPGLFSTFVLSSSCSLSSSLHVHYKLVIIHTELSWLTPPVKKRVRVIRELWRFRGRFKSVTEIKIRLMEEFEEQLPETTRFSLGYVEGRQSSTKRWLCCEEDLDAMYIQPMQVVLARKEIYSCGAMVEGMKIVMTNIQKVNDAGLVMWHQNVRKQNNGL